LVYLYLAIKMMHGPINLRFFMNIWEKRVISPMFVPQSLTKEQKEHTAKTQDDFAQIRTKSHFLKCIVTLDNSRTFQNVHGTKRRNMVWGSKLKASFAKARI